MLIKVRLFATLRDKRGKEVVLDLKEEAQAQELVKLLEIPEKEVAIFLINGRHGSMDQVLKEGDTVSIFPPIGGG